MAELLGFVASIAQLAQQGFALSSALCDYADRLARPEQDVADIADDVKTTAMALDGVATTLQDHNGIADVSKSALDEAATLTKRCEAVFAHVQDWVQKRSSPGQDGIPVSNAPDPLKEQRFHLLRRRLDNLKHSIMLLLHVLRLAHGQAKGNLKDSVLAQERETIRELHQRQQDSIRALQALEDQLGEASFFDDDETVRGSAAPTRVPTINLLVNSSARRVSLDGRAPGFDPSMAQAPSALADTSETSDSDDTVIDDDGELLTVNEIARCATQAQKLLRRITVLQQSCETGNPQSNRQLPRNRVLKIYRRFCRKFESEMIVHEAAAPAPHLESPSHRFQLVKTQEPARDSQSQAQHQTRTLPDPSGLAREENRTAQPPFHYPEPQNNVGTDRPATEAQYPSAAPAWTISSEPLGPGSRPKLPPLISTLPVASQASPSNDIMSPGDEHDNKHSGTDGDHDMGPVVYTKTGRISKAKKGLKVHVCQECGRSFTRAEHLRRHQKNHGPNQVRCELCGKVFFRADLLQRHLERHKDVPQGYRFSNAPPSSTEGASPTADDEAHHQRHIMPTPGHNASSMHPHHSPGGRSIDSGGASGAPTPAEVPAPSLAAAQRTRPAWETTNVQSVASHTPEQNAIHRHNTWQTVNAHDRMQDSPEATYPHASSPLVQQQPHSGLPKLQPKVAPANGAPNHKRYSNILPAPGAPPAPQHQPSYPQSHMPNMLPAQYGIPPTQAEANVPTNRSTYHDSNSSGAGQHAYPAYNDGRSPIVTSGTGLPLPPVQSRHTIATQSPTVLNTPGDTPRSLPVGSFEQSRQEGPSRAFQDNRRSSVDVKPGKVSSDKDGVNWRLAETESRQWRKRKHNRNDSQTDGDSSGNDFRGGSTADRTLDSTQRSFASSRSLSLVMPQDERDHALLGKGRPDDPRVATALSPHGGPPARALSPALATRRSSSRPSTEASDSRLPGETANPHPPRPSTRDGPETPEPESPYSLATINRYIKNQGPQPGVNQDEEMADSEPRAPPTVQISTAPCERCREYSIKCDGRLPQCTACATTKYAGECSFSSMSAHSALPGGPLPGPHPPQLYDSMSALTRQAMAEPQQRARPPRPTETLHPDQGYDSDGDLPSPYLRPRDKALQANAMAQVSNVSLDTPQAGDKRKAPAQQHGHDTAGDQAHGRKKPKSNRGEDAKGGGKDIVDMLLDQWSVPAH